MYDYIEKYTLPIVSYIISASCHCSFMHLLSCNQIATSSVASAFGDRRQFKNFFRTVSTSNNIARGLFSVLQHYGWHKVYFLNQRENLFTNVSLNFCLLEIGGEFSRSYIGSILYSTSWLLPEG